MEQVKIKDVKKGDFIKRKADAKKTYVRGDYIRADKTYECYDFDDISSFIYIKGDKLVFIDFDL